MWTPWTLVSVGIKWLLFWHSILMIFTNSCMIRLSLKNYYYLLSLKNSLLQQWRPGYPPKLFATHEANDKDVVCKRSRFPTPLPSVVTLSMAILRSLAILPHIRFARAISILREGCSERSTHLISKMVGGDIESAREHFERFCRDTCMTQKKSSKTMTQKSIDATKAYLKNVMGWQQQVFGEGPMDKAMLPGLKQLGSSTHSQPFLCRTLGRGVLTLTSIPPCMRFLLALGLGLKL